MTESTQNESSCEKTVLTIYGSGTSLVESMTAKSLQSGNNLVLLTDIASQYIAGTFRLLSEELTFFSASPANKGKWRLTQLKEQIGSHVRVSSAFGATIARGTLVDVVEEDNSSISITLEQDGTTLITLNDTLSLFFQKAVTPKAKGLEVAIKAPKAGQYDLHTLYQTNGLDAEMTLSADYDAEKQLITDFNISALISNNSGADFANAQVKLLFGDIGDGGSTQPGPQRMMMLSASMSDGSAGASQAAVGEQKIVVLPEPISIMNGAPTQVSLLSKKDIPAKKEFFMPAATGWQRGKQSDSLQQASARLIVINDPKYNLGALPACSVQIFEKANAASDKDDDDSCKSLTKTAVGSLNNVAEGEEFTLSMGTSTDVKVRRRLVDKQTNQPIVSTDLQTAEKQDAETGETTAKTATVEQWEVTVFNASDKEVTVKVEDNFANNFRVLHGELARNGATGAFLKVTAPAKEERKATYTVQIDEPSNK